MRTKPSDSSAIKLTVIRFRVTEAEFALFIAKAKETVSVFY